MDTKLADDVMSCPTEVPGHDAGHDAGEWSLPKLRPGEARETAEAGAADDGAFTIGDMARECGITVRAIRFYEDGGLLQPRYDGSARVYGPRERLHLKMILRGKELGFTLSEIKDILGARDAEEKVQDFAAADVTAADLGAIAMQPGGCGAFDALKLDVAMALRPEQIVAQIDHLERQRKALDDAIQVLRDAQGRRVARDRRNAVR